jgi:carboxyl-terminal processing protease
MNTLLRCGNVRVFVPILSALILGCATPGKPTITGVGVALGVEAQTLRIMKVLPDTPAARAGLSPGLVVQQIDGVATAGRRLEDCVAMLRGPAGTKAKLMLIETAAGRTNTVELTRERILLGARSPGRCGSTLAR